MEYSIKLHIIKSRYSIVYIEGSEVIISKKYCKSFSEDSFVLGNSADPEEMPHCTVLHLCFHCLLKYLLSTKG